MKNKLLLPSLLLMLISFSSFHDTDCSKLKHCRLQYLDIDDTSAYMIIDGNKLVEYCNEGKHYIKADIKWLSDCAYETILTEATVPNFPFTMGERMQVRIRKIENNIVEVTSTIRDKEYAIRYKLIR